MKRLLLPIAAAALFTAAPAVAHPKLVSASPAPNGVVARPTQLQLSYSEKLIPAMSGIALTMTAMPGMKAHAAMKVSGFTTSVAADGKTMVIALPRPLPAGTYEVQWHAVAADTHRITGAYSFQVK
jgi:methionine-rich copper-binding protein CopC